MIDFLIDFLLTFVVMFAITMTLMLACSPLYLRFGWLKWLYHDILGWHIPGPFTPIFFDGCSSHSTCQYCGKSITQDGQGNWY